MVFQLDSVLPASVKRKCVWRENRNILGGWHEANKATRCLSLFIRYHCGHPSAIWGALNPSEKIGPGVLWGNYDACVPNEGRDAEARVQVDFFCPSPLEVVHAYQCTFEGQLPPPPDDADAHAVLEALTAPVDGSRPPDVRDAAAHRVDSTLSGTPSARGQPVTTSAHLPIHTHTHVFEPGECQNGLPPGSSDVDSGCFTSLRWAEHCGSEFSWEALIPSEGTSQRAGVRWTSAENCTAVRAAVDYFCPIVHSVPVAAAGSEIHYSAPDVAILLNSSASVLSHGASGQYANPRPAATPVPRTQARPRITVPSLHRCSFNGTYEDVGRLKGSSCGRLYVIVVAMYE